MNEPAAKLRGRSRIYPFLSIAPHMGARFPDRNVNRVAGAWRPR